MSRGPRHARSSRAAVGGRSRRACPEVKSAESRGFILHHAVSRHSHEHARVFSALTKENLPQMPAFFLLGFCWQPATGYWQLPFRPKLARGVHSAVGERPSLGVAPPGLGLFPSPYPAFQAGHASGADVSLYRRYSAPYEIPHRLGRLCRTQACVRRPKK